MDNDVRMIALMALVDIIENDKYSHVVINDTLKKYQYISKTERAFFTRLCEGTIEYQLQLDYIINQFSSIPSKKMKPIIRNILRMSVYQIKYMDNVPDSAVCNEAVKLAGKKGFHNLKGFVNGVLRNIARNINNIKYPDEKKEYKKFLSVKYSTPEWIVEEWLKDYGDDMTNQLLRAFFCKSKTTICCNCVKNSVNDLIVELEKQEIKVYDGLYVKNAVKIDKYDYIGRILSFKEGKFFVQDESSMIAVEAAGITKDSIVIDVCAAPGGKTMYAASCMLNGTGKVISRDISEYKISLIENNIKRCGLENVDVQVKDALVFDEGLKSVADVVIADLPCSGLGVMGKKSDIKYKMTKETQDELVKLQRQILDVVRNYVKPGGVLLYSTCTINKNENEQNALWFQKEYDEFKLESLDEYISEKLHSDTTKKGYLQLLPKDGDNDGFFMARFKKVK